MAWTTLPTYTDGTALTAAMLNAIKGNINESAAAKATTGAQYFVSTAANTLAARTVDQDIVDTENTRTITTYGSLATNGPTVTMTTGTRALTWITSAMKTNVNGANAYVSINVSGASTIAPTDERGITWQGDADRYERWTVCALFTTLTAGSNTLEHQYRVDTNTGSFKWRRIAVMGF